MADREDTITWLCCFAILAALLYEGWGFLVGAMPESWVNWTPW